MSTVQLPNIRIGSDVVIKAKLYENGVAVNWSTLTGVKAFAYSDTQRIMGGELECAVSQSDPYELIVNYRTTVLQYLGPVRLVVRGVYQSNTKTFDVPAFNFVATTAEATGVTVLADPQVSVDLRVKEIASSVIQEIVDACIIATGKCTEAYRMPLQVKMEGNHLYASYDRGVTWNDLGEIQGTGGFDIHTLTPDTYPANADEFAMYKSSASAHRKITWQNIMSRIQTALGSVFAALSHTHTKSQITDLDMTAYRTSTAQDAIDAGKVDKVTGKGLSTNDYDSTEKANVAANTSARHTHSNKGVLDGITQALINAWNGAVSALSGKQDTLVSGTNIKTVNNQSLLGSGNIEIQGGSSFDIHSLTTEDAIANADELPFYDTSASGSRKTTWQNLISKINTALSSVFQPLLTSGTNIKTINGNSVLGSGNIDTSENFIITCTMSLDGQGNPVISDVSKTYAEIVAADAAGKHCVLHTSGLLDAQLPLISVNSEDATFTNTTSANYQVHYLVISILANNSTWAGMRTLAQLTDIPTIATTLNAQSVNTQTAGAKAVYDAIEAEKVDKVTVADDGQTTTATLDVNTQYIFTTRATNLTITLGSAISGKLSLYAFDIQIDATTLPTITVTGISGLPTFALGKYYSIIIDNGKVFYKEF